MNSPTIIATALLDSSAEEFLKAYKRDNPLRWEYTQFERLPFRFLVARWTFDGKRLSLGAIERTRKYPESWKIFCRTRKSDGSSSLDYTQGQFKTREAAAQRLWELYELT